MTPGTGGRRHCFVIHPFVRRTEGHERAIVSRLAEAIALAQAIDLVVDHAEVTPLTRVRSSTLLGAGTVARLTKMLSGEEASSAPAVDVVIVDHPLTPVQQRNLERALNVKVIDRSGLILEIFGARARTDEGELQVELAALSYQRSRLVRSWTHLERQRGGFGFLGGPGESQLETDRRLIDERIVRLKRELERVRRTRSLHRAARRRVPYPVIALVGYTNAGKSTLFNQLTGADVFVRDQLFATLDPTMRLLILPSGRRAILADTVGFISDLPHELIEAFRATLEEVTMADLLLHVRDVSHPESVAQRKDVEAVLSGLFGEGRPRKPMIEVLNKADILPEDERQALAAPIARGREAAVLVSARTGEGLPHLLELVDTYLGQCDQQLSLVIPVADGALLAWLYRHGQVVQREDRDDGIHLDVRMSPRQVDQLARRVSDIHGVTLATGTTGVVETAGGTS